MRQVIEQRAWNGENTRAFERLSIREFLGSCAHEFQGNDVLDVGCGLQPYRDIVENAGGRYVGFDRAAFPANVSGQDVGADPFSREWPVMLSVQVVQYVQDPLAFLIGLHDALERPGVLICSYPIAWDVVEAEDLWRFTPAGIDLLLARAGFTVRRNEVRAEIRLGDFGFPLGGGVVADA